MSYYHNHNHTTNLRSNFTSGKSPQTYASVVGTVVQDSEKPITGRSGDHLQFYVDIGGGTRYQVDVNTQSSDGSEVEVYVANEAIPASTANANQPFGPQAYGLFPDAKLSYAGLGLTNNDFEATPYSQLDNLLKAKLDASTFVAIYGMTFDDGGENGKGIHETHFNHGKTNQDGALVIYSIDPNTNATGRTWFFFKFNEDSVGA